MGTFSKWVDAPPNRWSEWYPTTMINVTKGKRDVLIDYGRANTETPSPIRTLVKLHDDIKQYTGDKVRFTIEGNGAWEPIVKVQSGPPTLQRLRLHMYY